MITELFLILSITSGSPKVTESDIATCTGMVNAMQDIGVYRNETDTISDFYSTEFAGILKKHGKIPSKILEQYTSGYQTGLSYRTNTVGQQYWQCVMFVK